MCDEKKSGLELQQVLDDLRKPFHPSQITWKPGAVKGDRALALAYADLRAYMNRLDEVCGTEWSVAYEPWGEDRIICRLTILGVTRSSTGETTNEAERSEIGGTVAEAQAFKRASAMFGLGRYLYNLPTGWADFDPTTKRFTEKAKARLMGILVQHYRRATDVKSEMADLFAAETSGEHEGEGAEPVTEAHQNNGESNGNGPEKRDDHVNGHSNGTSNGTSKSKGKAGANSAKAASGSAPVPAALIEQFNSLGHDLYGDQWEQVCRRNVQRISGGKAEESGELTPDQIQQLVVGMTKLKSKRQPAEMAN